MREGNPEPPRSGAGKRSDKADLLRHQRDGGEQSGTACPAETNETGIQAADDEPFDDVKTPLASLRPSGGAGKQAITGSEQEKYIQVAADKAHQLKRL